MTLIKRCPKRPLHARKKKKRFFRSGTDPPLCDPEFWGKYLVWVIRALLPVPFIFVAPEIWQSITNYKVGIDRLTISTADVFGNGAIIFLWIMLAVTPVITMTGWKWHRPLRQNFGVGLFLCALADFTIAFLFTGDHIKGGLFTHIFGHAILVAGSLAFLCTIPLALTASKRAQRWLGPHWRWLHRMTFFVWGFIMLHMFFLFGFASFFFSASLISAPLIILRLPFVAKWWTNARRTHTELVGRYLLAMAFISMFMIGFVAFFDEFLNVGIGALLLHPPG